MHSPSGGPPHQTYQMYIHWSPTGNEVLGAGLPVIEMFNTLPIGAFTMGSIPDTEVANWSALYSKTKLAKVVVKFTPSSTVFSGQGLNQAATMTTIPIYDNYDDIISTGGQLTQDPAANNILSHMKQKPYARTTSIYKPWTRVIKPKNYLEMPGYFGPDTFKPSTQWFDLSQTGIRIGGLYIIMNPITNYVTGTPSPVYTPEPTINDAGLFCLGRLTFTMYQRFKTRV